MLLSADFAKVDALIYSHGSRTEICSSWELVQN
jgi:hypothetical protein